MGFWLKYGFLSLALVAAIPAMAQAEGKNGCGKLFPPSSKHQDKQDDYWDPAPIVRKHLRLVNGRHFDPYRSLEGHTPMAIIDNLDYTLRHFPNHPQALYTVSEFGLRRGGQLPQKAGWKWHRSVECYFDRAIRFRPKDGVVRLLYGIYLHRSDKLKKALEQYEVGLKLIPKSSELNYNVGLLYYDLKKYKLANKYAAIAYKLGYPLPGLRNMLKKVGHWP